MWILITHKENEEIGASCVCGGYKDKPNIEAIRQCLNCDISMATHIHKGGKPWIFKQGNLNVHYELVERDNEKHAGLTWCKD